jgi:hypothetical protein
LTAQRHGTPRSWCERLAFSKPIDEDGVMTRARGVYLTGVVAASLVAVSVIEARLHPDASVLGGGAGATVLVLSARIALVAAAVDVVRRRELALAAALLAAGPGLALYVLPEPAPGAALLTAGLLGAGLAPLRPPTPRFSIPAASVPAPPIGGLR